MAKRRNGEGTWGKKKIHGNVYYYYKDSKGHYTYGKTETVVREKLKSGTKKPYEKIDDKHITVGTFVKDWLYRKKYQEVGISIQSTTFDAYENGLKVRFFEFTDYPLALRSLQALSTAMINDYFRALAQKYSRSSIRKVWEVLRMCFTDEDYSNHHLVPQEINFRKIRIPSESNVVVKKREIQFTSAEDMETLYQEAFKVNPRSGHGYGNAAKMLVFIMYSGLRLAEACGLTWKYVDMDNGFITIASTYIGVNVRDEAGKIIEYKYINKAPKTENSAATIPYRRRAGEILKLMEMQNIDHKPNDYVFVSENGTPYKKRAVERTLERMLKNAGLGDRGYTVHSLRHGYGSILFQEGVDIKTISRLLRHSDISTTANIYISTTNDTLKKALQSVDK